MLPSSQRTLKSNDSALPVNVLKAVERSQQASPIGDVDTEAHENSIDETRRSEEEHLEADEFDREMRPPNLNGTFIVNTHNGESW